MAILLTKKKKRKEKEKRKEKKRKEEKAFGQWGKIAQYCTKSSQTNRQRNSPNHGFTYRVAL